MHLALQANYLLLPSPPLTQIAALNTRCIFPPAANIDKRKHPNLGENYLKFNLARLTLLVECSIFWLALPAKLHLRSYVWDKIDAGDGWNCEIGHLKVEPGAESDASTGFDTFYQMQLPGDSILLTRFFSQIKMIQISRWSKDILRHMFVLTCW